MLDVLNSYEVIQSQTNDEQYDEPGARGGLMTDQRKVDQGELRDVAQLEHQAMALSKKVVCQCICQTTS
jgi:hypothetical protein